jgi:hypothetical protein
MILRLAVHDKLSTQGNLHAYGIVQDVHCILCGLKEKNQDHLLFSCPYSE